jgi:imidazolonepropionase-like amidohydrolase
MTATTDQRTRTLLRADRLLADAEVTDGAMLVEGSAIVAVGPWSELPQGAVQQTQVIGLGDPTLLPDVIGCLT